MPTVPTYGGSQVPMTVTPPARFIAPAVANPLPELAQKIGGTETRLGIAAGAIANHEQDLVNQSRVDGANNKLTRLDQVLEYGPDGKGGFSKIQGENALIPVDGVGLHGTVMQSFQKGVDEIKKGLGNREQKIAFSESADAVAEKLSARVMKHVSGAQSTYRAGLNSGSIKLAQEQMGLSWSNPDRVAIAGEAIKSNVAERGRLMGWSKEQTATETISQLSRGNASVIDNAVSSGNTDYARAYLKANVSEMTPEGAASARALVHTGRIKDKSLSLSLGMTGDSESKRKKLDGMFLSGKISASLRDATLARINQDERVSNEQAANDAKATIGKAQDFLIKNPDASITDLPASIYSSLETTGHLATMSNFAKTRHFPNNEAAWAKVLSASEEKLASVTPSEFYSAYRGSLDDRHLERGMAMVNVARRSEGASPAHLQLASATQIIKQSAQENGLYPLTGSFSSKEKLGEFTQFEDTVNSRVHVFEQNTLGGKRKANTSELRDIINNVLTNKVYVSGWLHDSQVVTSLATPEQLKDAYVNVSGHEIKLTSIPPEQRALIIQAARKYGVPVSEQMIADKWVAMGSPK